jgi:hypothetical protein
VISSKSAALINRAYLILLLSLLSDLRTARAELKGSEQTWLKRVGKQIDFSDRTLRTSFTADQLALAEAAYTLLTQGPPLPPSQ